MLRHLRSITLGCVLMMAFAFIVAPAAGQLYFPPDTYVSWNPSGEYIAVGSETTLTIYDANTGAVLNRLNDVLLVNNGAAPEWSPDGTKLAIQNGPDIEVWEEVWSQNDAKHLFTYGYYIYSEIPSIRERANHVAAIAWNSDGTQLALAAGQSVYILDGRTGTHINRISDNLWGFNWDLDWSSDNRIAVANYEDTVFIINPNDGLIQSYLYVGVFTTGKISAVAFNADGTRLVAGKAEGEIVLWNDTFPETEFIDEASLTLTRGGTPTSGTILDLEWSPNGQYIASVSRDHTVKIWESVTGRLLHTIELSLDVNVASIAWSPDGSKLAYGNADGSVTLFDATQLPGYEPMTEASSND